MLRSRFSVVVLCVLAWAFVRVSPVVGDDSGLTSLVQVLQQIDDAAVQADLLAGMRDGLKGRKTVAMPDGWSKAYASLAKSGDAKVREHAEALAIVFGDETALAAAQARALSPDVPVDQRVAALEMLIEKRPRGFAPVLHQCLSDAALCRSALRGLGAYADAETSALILKEYPRFTADEKQDALATLSSRREFALALINAVEAGQVPRSDLLPVLVRQLHALGDKALSRRVNEVWGDVRETPTEKLAKIEKYKQQLTTDRLDQADLRRGKQVFQKTCQQCHVLYGEGAKIGPDLTGSNRANLDYVLTNVIDPSAVIPREYKMHVVITTDGRVLTGMILERNGDRITLQSVNERLTLLESDIDELVESEISMMPEGQLDALSADEVRDLVAYLATKKPIE